MRGNEIESRTTVTNRAIIDAVIRRNPSTVLAIAVDVVVPNFALLGKESVDGVIRRVPELSAASRLAGWRANGKEAGVLRTSSALKEESNGAALRAAPFLCS